ncbi:MAG: RidA family protein [Acidimicrobiales bacterium]
MVSIEAKLEERGLRLPPRQVVPPGQPLTYRRLVRHGELVYLAGHGPTLGDRWAYQGKIGLSVTVDEGVKAAEVTALNLLATIARELGDLDGVGSWLKVTGYVNAVEGFTEQAHVMNGCTDLLLDLYGSERLASRTSVGVADLPFNMPVEIDAVLVWNGQ